MENFDRELLINMSAKSTVEVEGKTDTVVRDPPTALAALPVMISSVDAPDYIWKSACALCLCCPIGLAGEYRTLRITLTFKEKYKSDRQTTIHPSGGRTDKKTNGWTN